MIDVYTLSKSEIRDLIHYVCFNKPIESQTLKERVKESESWSTEITIITLLFSLVLENIEGDKKESVIEEVYTLEDFRYTTINEMDRSFIEYMLSNVNEYEDMETFIVELSNRYAKNEYDKNIRM